MAKKRNKKQSKFRDKVAKNAQNRKNQDRNYGYLQIPGDIKIFKDFGGRIKFDIIPYEVTDKKHMDADVDESIAVPGELWYRRPFKIHRNVGVAKDTVICPTTFGKKCPICDYRTKRVKEGADKEELDALRPSARNLYVIIPKGVKDHDDVLHLFDISNFAFQKLLDEELREDPDNGVFPDLEEGKTLRVRFEMEKFGTNEFPKATRIDFLDREEGYDDELLEKVPKLDDLLILLEYDALEAKFFEIDDEESKSSKKKKNEKKPNKKSKPVEDDDEDEDEDDEDWDDEDEDEDEDDWDDEDDEDEDYDDDEDEEEEKPKRKKAASKSTPTKSNSKKKSKKKK